MPGINCINLAVYESRPDSGPVSKCRIKFMLKFPAPDCKQDTVAIDDIDPESGH